MEINNGCKAILRRLFNQGRIGGKHIPMTICKRWIKHLNADEYKKAFNDFDFCIKQGLVLTKPKPSDIHIFLNPRRLKEIREIIGE
ncbi:MAG: hypothetical protein Q8R00_02570 [Candidatus Nanoarchaeia archaeon]|nr:hypothetical protein [Candidatus Nanoarchaeia archaeon]